MSERFKYAKNGICRFENFAEHVAAGTFLRIELGRLCGMNWYSNLRIAENDADFYLVIYNDNNNPEVKYNVQVHYNMLNNSNGIMHRVWRNIQNYEDTEKKILSVDHIYFGYLTSISEILDLKNGWLDGDGALSYEYGIQVEAIMKHKVWRFNHKDKLFNAGAEMIELKKINADSSCLGFYYLHAQILTHHSQMCADLISHMTKKKRINLSGSRDSFSYSEDALQVLHGVRLHLKHDRLLSVLSMANWLKMRNVVYYCDVLLTQRRRRSRYRSDKKKWISLANKYNLRHWMVQLLKPMKSVKDCVDEENIEKMSNESMKMFMAKFLYEKF